MSNFEITEITGVIPALVTPFDEDENFDSRRMENIVDFLIAEGVHGLYLTGSTGECFLMTPEERKEVVRVVVDKVKGRIPVIVHVGAISTKISSDLARYAYEAGADAISSVPPFYWKFEDKHIFRYYEELSDVTPLPMIIYNVPFAGLLGFDFIKKLSTIKNVKGIKYTAYTHQDIHKAKDQIGKDFMVYSGADEMAVSGLLNEADGIIGSFYNILADAFIDIYNNVKKGDFMKAQFKQKIAVDIIDASLEFDYYSSIKTAMSWMGVDAGFVRRPFQNLGLTEAKKLKTSYNKIRDFYGVNDIKVLNSI
jgi:N-acetylneuraminate lyase